MKSTLPYKLGGTDDPHFPPSKQTTAEWVEECKQQFFKETEDVSRTEATCDWYDNLRDDGRSDGQGESYGERQ